MYKLGSNHLFYKRLINYVNGYEELAKSAATAAQQHAADASAAEQEALVAAAEEDAIATRQTNVVLHLRMTRPTPTKMRATTTVLTTMMTQLK